MPSIALADLPLPSHLNPLTALKSSLLPLTPSNPTPNTADPIYCKNCYDLPFELGVIDAAWARKTGALEPFEANRYMLHRRVEGKVGVEGVPRKGPVCWEHERDAAGVDADAAGLGVGAELDGEGDFIAMKMGENWVEPEGEDEMVRNAFYGA